MKIALACGGTGGHIFPGLATAQVLQERGHDVTLWLAGKDVEGTAVRSWTGPVVTVQSQGFEGGSWRAVGTAWRLLGAVTTCIRLMRRRRPDVLLAMGSYACVGPLGAATWLGVPYVLHESNVLPGRAVSLFAGRASAVAGCFEETRYYLRRRPLELTGMPLRQELAQAARSPSPPRVGGRPFTLLIMGGSRGSRALNDIATEALRDLSAAGRNLRVIHLSGPHDAQRVAERYREAGATAEVRAFEHDMASVYAEADLAICRSGAASCAELSAFGVPALLVPYPHAARDHQMANARAMERMHAADVVPEHDLTPGWLARYVAEAMQEPERLRKMAEASHARALGDGAHALADLLERVGATNAARSPAPA